ncbi:MAG: hypothetical protein A3B74_04020 [Candidatus Kerfeldbacteria bacterium RIFCSPHIGHO2_02_FULL_42_14]|uniref:Uncharacterized protein n=1 Tax=Candidatus Kerfeldbacteria bacterium RIFCSPHIGHO2_02_FULL_42_14 TaxID=1798540 RepID=A0A1G2AQ56_9BACT|nr:MAG: hypothetical protein A3B74_04020 [Candidatus Kerfeldbacteria bacterium RIFCSPHIGHO2_02_FULL_42_14]OGY80676.1 MAG: hypothetical protein A3E60_04515 [Candidatus Kerfeldbacteria bacterium RIFCSPHIGHO2_12_FULL_42_13]OGY82603.1 MAG: hypothetical protein A3I91_04180 [Candidatus Kerfeldbacteria bacterium RIFCSPLOWO2_02_FULL_42_19]OGY85206.1 MAG: hypothetical protein A3G01_01310 [Candidatus Kerfeldbacteria bacterium RIFCSPLOWO2_12_FULL_43_9]
MEYAEVFHESLKIVSFCPMCRLRYDPLKAEVIGQSDNARLIYIRCQRCSISMMALIALSALGINSAVLVTDANSADIRRLQKREKVTFNDVIEVYQYIQSKRFTQYILHKVHER